jgi:hypothetical protein
MFRACDNTQPYRRHILDVDSVLREQYLDVLFDIRRKVSNSPAPQDCSRVSLSGSVVLPFADKKDSFCVLHAGSLKIILQAQRSMKQACKLGFMLEVI